MNAGRIAEVATGNCDYPTAEPLPETDLPPKGPYPAPYATLKAKSMLEDLAKAVGAASDRDVKKVAVRGIWEVVDVMK